MIYETTGLIMLGYFLLNFIEEEGSLDTSVSYKEGYKTFLKFFIRIFINDLPVSIITESLTMICLLRDSELELAVFTTYITYANASFNLCSGFSVVVRNKINYLIGQGRLQESYEKFKEFEIVIWISIISITFIIFSSVYLCLFFNLYGELNDQMKKSLIPGAVCFFTDFAIKFYKTILNSLRKQKVLFLFKCLDGLCLRNLCSSFRNLS